MTPWVVSALKSGASELILKDMTLLLVFRLLWRVDV